MKKFFLWVLVAVVLVSLYHTPSMVESSIPSIYYVTPNIKTYETVISCTGTIQAGTLHEIYLDAPVVPAEVFAEVGDKVEKGTLLARINTEKTQALSVQPLQILQQLAQAQFPSGEAVMSEIDWGSIASRYGLSAVLSGNVGPEQVAALLSGNESQGISSAVAASWVNNSTAVTRITSPANGIVTQIDLKPQVPALTGKAVITVADTASYKVLAAVGEGDIAKIKVGDTGRLRGVGFGGTIYNGTVTKIYPTAHKAYSGAVTETVVDVEITIGKPDDKLKPGFTAKVEIKGDENYNLITVPYEAIRQDENNDEYVYVYKEGKLRKTAVVTGQELTNEVQVLDGLEPDSVVIFNPGDIVHEGSMINIKGRADVH